MYEFITVTCENLIRFVFTEHFIKAYFIITIKIFCHRKRLPKSLWRGTRCPPPPYSVVANDIKTTEGDFDWWLRGSREGLGR